MMDVSVIVPVYNGENYIATCIRSILAQNNRNFELIIVDDGSTDSSGIICDAFADKDSRIRVIHKKNEGVNNARIEGLSAARFGLISFVDSDDWVDENFLRQLVNVIETEDADMVISGCIFEEKRGSRAVKNLIPSGVYEGDKLETMLFPQMLYYKGFYEFGIMPYMCNKIFRKELLSKYYLDIDRKIYDGEDVAVVYPYLLSSRKVVVIEDCMYHYRIHENSMTCKMGEEFYENVSRLYLYLNKMFQTSKYYGLMRPQLDEYMRMMVWKGTPAEMRGKTERYFFPFTKVMQNSDIILYGAGEVGKKYYQQIMRTKYCRIVSWADKNYLALSSQGINIDAPETAVKMEFDYIVIANMTKKIRREIKLYLMSLGVKENMIVMGEEE